MFLWPIHKFWTFTPWGWLLAVVWNITEVCGVGMPWAGEVFGVIMGKKVRVSDADNPRT